MYKVFINDKPIILTTSTNNEKEYPLLFFDNIIFEEVVEKLKSDIFNGFYLFSTNEERDFNKIKKVYKPVVAGGGLVVNEKGEVLFIFREGKWDLPKGRVEKGEKIQEGAIREVEEECGIRNISLKKLLLVTHHLFVYKEKKRLKETHWYLMYSNSNQPLQPQFEEGITEVCFKSKKEIEKALLNTYANIKSVYQSYIDLQL